MPPVRFLLILLLAASCHLPRVHAMAIHDFTRLNDDDQAAFVATLVAGSADLLKKQGHPDQAQTVIAFFKDPSPDGGMKQFVSHFKEVDALNKRNSINPNSRAHTYVVEDAMAITLKDKGVNVPAGYLLAVSKTFVPSGPMRPWAAGQ
jgi:hypothetical protein